MTFETQRAQVTCVRSHSTPYMSQPWEFKRGTRPHSYPKCLCGDWLAIRPGKGWADVIDNSVLCPLWVSLLRTQKSQQDHRAFPGPWTQWAFVHLASSKSGYGNQLPAAPGPLSVSEKGRKSRQRSSPPAPEEAPTIPKGRCRNHLQSQQCLQNCMSSAQ